MNQHKWALQVTDNKLIKQIKTQLENEKLISKVSKITRQQDNSFLIPLSITSPDQLPSHFQNHGLISVSTADEINKNDSTFHKNTCSSIISQILDSPDIKLPPGVSKQQLIDSFPHRYQLYEPLILFSAGTLSNNPLWSPLLHSQGSSNSLKFFSLLCEKFSSLNKSQTFTHVAENAPISDKNDILRLPSKIIPLYPLNSSDKATDFDNLWVHTTQNGIHQTWSPAHTMFSRGNIKEKARVLKFAKETINLYSAAYNNNGKGDDNNNIFLQKNEKYRLALVQWEGRPMAVDMYAGIGYFTFSYLKAGFSAVLCWELNPWSIKGLLMGSGLNGWDSQLFVTQTEKEDESGSSNENDPINPVTRFDKKLFAKFLYSDSSRTKKNNKIAVFQEDNIMSLERIKSAVEEYKRQHQTVYSPLIAHINLGLLPTTNLAWPTAVEIALYSSAPQVYLHIHANLSPNEMDPWIESTIKQLQSLIKTLSEETTKSLVSFIHLEKIKTYAPGVWHICGDFLIDKN